MIQLRCASPFQTGTSRTAFRVCDNIAAVHLHKRRFDEKPCLAAAAAADHDDVLISRVLRLLRAAVHGKPFRLREGDIVLKYWVCVWLYVLGCPPTCAAVLHAFPVLLRVLALDVDNQPDNDRPGNADK